MNIEQAKDFQKWVEKTVSAEMHERKIDPVDVTIEVRCAVRDSITSTISRDPRE